MPPRYNIVDICKELQTSGLHKPVLEQIMQRCLRKTLSASNHNLQASRNIGCFLGFILLEVCSNGFLNPPVNLHIPALQRIPQLSSSS